MRVCVIGSSGRASVAVKDGAPAEVSKQNASWIREGDYRLELRVNERVVAAGSLSLNVVVVEARSAQAQSFPVLDSETIFDGAERRVGSGG